MNSKAPLGLSLFDKVENTNLILYHIYRSLTEGLRVLIVSSFVRLDVAAHISFYFISQ